MKLQKRWRALIILAVVAVGLIYLQAPGASDQLEVHFLDVGQGDSILIRLPNERTVLIDAGESKAGAGVVSYLKQRGITTIDYLIATHPHADHIGGMIRVIEAFDIGMVYLPKVSHTSRTYENLLLAIQAKGLKITSVRAGLKMIEEEGLAAVFAAPSSSSYENLNNYSAVIKVEYGATSLLLAGDAEAESEQEMLAGNIGLKADLLKVGHHGSSSSTTETFLNAVSPSDAVISCGQGNQYGHPHRETLDRLARAGIEIYRTDTDGTVVFISDGLALTPGGESFMQKAVAVITRAVDFFIHGKGELDHITFTGPVRE